MEKINLNNETRLLSIKETCERLGIGHWALYQQINQNTLKTVKIGKRRLISTNAINEFIENLEK